MTGSTMSALRLWKALSQDAGAVDDDVDRAERVERRLDDGLAAGGGGHRVGVGDGLGAEVEQLLHDLLGRTDVAALARQGAAEVVDHDAGPATGELQGVRAAQPTPGAGDDGHLAVEADVSHGILPLPARGRVVVSETGRGYRPVGRAPKPAAAVRVAAVTAGNLADDVARRRFAPAPAPESAPPMAPTISTEKVFKRHQKVVAAVDLPGVAAGTPGKVSYVAGVTWIRYHVAFDNGVDMSSLDAVQLADRKAWKAAEAARDAEERAAAREVERAELRAELLANLADGPAGH